jgi:hypothetical protein
MSDAEASWAEISDQISSEAEYNNSSLIDVLKSIRDLLQEAFTALEDDPLPDEVEATVWLSLDTSYDEIGIAITALTQD